jgi:signal transduction histidine kinase
MNDRVGRIRKALEQDALAERAQRTKADLQATQSIYRQIAEQATDLIYIVDPEMRVVFLNQSAMQTFSRMAVKPPPDGPSSAVDARPDPKRSESFIGQRLDALVNERDARAFRREVDLALKQQTAHFYEHTADLGGRKVRFTTKLIPIRDETGSVYLILGLSRDITEKREMDERIYHTEKLASIGTLAAGVAHEINNPLAVILGYTELLLERFPAASRERDDLKVIEYHTGVAKTVVDKLLGFARVTEGLEDTVDLVDNIMTVANIVKNTLMTKKINLVLDIPEGLPRVRGDAREFQQVIFNLIINSVAAMEGGGILVLEGQASEDWVSLSVTDTGVGIPHAVRGRIFDPFFTTKRVGEGTGLGLSLCYGIVKKYGGNISFSSVSAEEEPEGNSGTTFTVSMPIARAEDLTE